MAVSNKQQSKIFYYPSPSRIGYLNPYSYNYKEALGKEHNLINKENRSVIMMGLDFFINSFKADLFIINWLESICFFRLGWIQFLLAQAGLWIIKKRGKKIVWMFHNIHPHQGNNRLSKRIQKDLFRQANLIISHSKEATEYAKKMTEQKVIFINHPIKPIKIKKINANIPPFDVLIWGTLLPYKGIAEFISHNEIQQSNITIRILGICKDEELLKRINQYCNNHIIFENRKANFDEIAAYIQKSRYVLFPYIGSCVSSSGALIDTLVLGGVPIGPNRGAFKDLAEQKLCLTYNSYEELINLINSQYSINNKTKETFISTNSWDNLVKTIFQIIKI